jgi:hypothetical protein
MDVHKKFYKIGYYSVLFSLQWQEMRSSNAALAFTNVYRQTDAFRRRSFATAKATVTMILMSRPIAVSI